MYRLSLLKMGKGEKEFNEWPLYKNEDRIKKNQQQEMKKHFQGSHNQKEATLILRLEETKAGAIPRAVAQELWPSAQKQRSAAPMPRRAQRRIRTANGNLDLPFLPSSDLLLMPPKG